MEMTLRRLAAILVADVVGYSRLVSDNESEALAALHTLRHDVIAPSIAAHSGRLFKVMGDGFLVEFTSAVHAVTCAIAIQKDVEAIAARASSRQMRLRIGVHLGDVVVEGEDLMGDGINIAARLESIAAPGGIFVSRAVHDQVRDQVEVNFEDRGEVSLKNITRPVQVYEIVLTKAFLKPAEYSQKFSMAVLPFQNLSSDPEQGYFAQGLAANLTTDLSRIAGLFVIASTTAATFGDKIVDARLIGRDLGVRYALQGGVQKSGSRVRVNAQMVDTSNGAQLWSDRFDGDQADLFEMQDQITSRIANSIGREMVLVAARDAEKRRIDPHAADYYVRGVAIADKPQTFENLLEQEGLFRQALALDPLNVDAWARLARSILLQRVQFSSSLMPEELEDKLTEGTIAVEKALALDANSARAHLAEGLLHQVLRNPAECARANETAIALDRNLSLAHNNLGSALINLGRAESAFPWIEKGIQLDPLGPQVGIMQVNMGRAHFFLCQTDQAIMWLQKARASNPRLVRAHAFLALAYAQKGDQESARRSLTDLLRVGPQFRLSVGPDVPGPLSPLAYREYYDRILLPHARTTGLPE
jgi:adenylate cyclase